MKIIIVGRTGTGKTTLAKAIARTGDLRLLKTCTTRAPRDNEDRDAYHFMTKAEADQVMAKYLYTEIGGEQYFCRKEDLKACDIAILDPDGLQDITALLPDEMIYLIHCRVDLGNDTAVSLFEAHLDERIAAADDPEAIRKAISDKRYSENERFSQLENLLFSTDIDEATGRETPKIFNDERYHGKIFSLYDYNNSFDSVSLQSACLLMAGTMRRIKNLRTIVEQCVELEVLQSPEPGKIQALAGDGKTQVLRSIDEIACLMTVSQSSMHSVINSWLTHKLKLELLPQSAPEPLFKV